MNSGDTEQLYRRIKVISNKTRFRILQLTQEKALSITELSERLKLAYTKTADYVALLEAHELVQKERSGKETLVRSVVTIREDRVIFP